MMTSTWDVPHCSKRGAKIFWSSQILSIPCAPNQVSKTPSDIWFWNIMRLCIGTSNSKWISWTSHEWELPIDMLSKSSRNLGTGTSGSLGLQICNNQRMVKATLTTNVEKSNPSHTTRRVIERRRRTLKIGAISTKSPGKTPMNVTQKSHWWPRSNKKSGTQIHKKRENIDHRHKLHCYRRDHKNSTRRTNKSWRGGAPVPFTDVGEGDPISFNCW